VQVLSKFHALRATVIRLWMKSSREIDKSAMDELIRFNEGIDQALSESSARFMERIEESRDFAIAVLAHDLRNPLNATVFGRRRFCNCPAYGSEIDFLLLYSKTLPQAAFLVKSRDYRLTYSSASRSHNSTPIQQRSSIYDLCELKKLCEENITNDFNRRR
jgi:signal transduction histidine kinase